MIVARVSHLEAFRYWRENEEADLEPLLASLRGEADNEAMRVGRALHKALEHAQTGTYATLEAEGYRFVIECEIELQLPEVRELRAAKAYGELTVTGCVDIIEGKRVDDHKTTGRLDIERYFEGYSWRYYLDIFGADVFRWNVFEISQIDGQDDMPTYSVYGFHQFEQHRYPQLAQDCANLARDFYRFAIDNNVDIRTPTVLDAAA